MSRREEMIKSIKQGNSILLMDGFGGFKQYTLANIEQLPSDAELALGDAKEEKKALEAIEKQVAQLEAAKKKLEASQKRTEEAKKTAAAEQLAKAAAAEAAKATKTASKTAKKGGKTAKTIETELFKEQVSDENEVSEEVVAE